MLMKKKLVMGTVRMVVRMLPVIWGGYCPRLVAPHLEG